MAFSNFLALHQNASNNRAFSIRSEPCCKDRLARRSLFMVIAGLLLCTVAPSRADAQAKTDAPKPGWVRSFNDVTVTRIKPEDLPETTQPGAMIGLRTSSEDLPRHASQENLERLAKQVRPRVLRIVAVQTPPRPYRQVPMLFFGHAVWVTPPPPTSDAEGESSKTKGNSGAKSAAQPTTAATPQRPVLISSLNWLSKADRVYALPQDLQLDATKKSSAKHVKKTDSSGASWRARRLSLEQLTAGTGGQKWLKENLDKLVELAPRHPDRHRNLVQLSSDDSDLAGGASGFELFDPTQNALFKLYGFSPYAGEFLSATKILANHPDNPALSFYWQTNYAAILGAPLIAGNGKLVAINTLQHPDKEKVFLSVPTNALKSYLVQTHDTKDLKNDDDK